MYGVDLYRRVRLACHRESLSRREASRQFGIDRKTVAKILLHSEPPGYRRRQPPKRPKLAPFTDIIDGILEEDRTVHRKQRHTAKRIFERLRDEHGFTGKQTIVKDYVRERHLGLREMFVPLAHPPGHVNATRRQVEDLREEMVELAKEINAMPDITPPAFFEDPLGFLANIPARVVGGSREQDRGAERGRRQLAAVEGEA